MLECNICWIHAPWSMKSTILTSCSTCIISFKLHTFPVHYRDPCFTGEKPNLQKVTQATYVISWNTGAVSKRNLSCSRTERFLAHSTCLRLFPVWVSDIRELQINGQGLYTKFLSLGTIAIWGQLIFCCEGSILCIVGYLVATLVSNPETSVAVLHLPVTTNIASRYWQMSAGCKVTKAENRFSTLVFLRGACRPWWFKVKERGEDRLT